MRDRHQHRSTIAAALVIALAAGLTVVPATTAATGSYSANAAVRNYARMFQLGPDDTHHVLTDTTQSVGSTYVSDHDGIWGQHVFTGLAGDLALDADGNPVVALRGNNSTGTPLVSIATESGGVWSTEPVVTGMGDFIPTVRLAVAPDGTMWVAYGSNLGIQITSKPSGGDWSAADLVDAPTRPLMFEQGDWDMVVDDTGTPHVVVAGHYPNSPIGSPCVVDGGCTVDMTPDGSGGWDVEPISGWAGIAEAIWTAAGGLEVVLNDTAKITYVGKVSGDWVTQDVVTVTGDASLTRGPSGPVILYTTASTSMRRADRSGSAWTTAPILTGRVYAPMGGFDGSGRLHTAYHLAYDDPTYGSTADVYVRAPDDDAPTVGPPAIKTKVNATMGTTVPSTVIWTGADSQSGIDHYALQQRTDGGSWSTVSSSLTTRSTTKNLSIGHKYEFRVRGYDKAGHASALIQGPPVTLSRYQESSSVIHYTGSWPSSSSSSASGGKTRYSASSTAKATITFTGVSFAWVAPKSSGRGRADVWIDGNLAAEVDLYRSSGLSKVIVYAMRWPTSGTHTVEIRNLKTSGRPRVDIDAIVIGR